MNTDEMRFGAESARQLRVAERIMEMASSVAGLTAGLHERADDTCNIR
jgi:hypothetical protein